MLTILHASGLALLLLAQPQPEQETVRGVVWSPPEEPRMVLQDVRAMREAGVEAARIPFGASEAVYQAAARGDLTLFVDLPVANLAGSRLADTLNFAERALDEVAALANRFGSISAVGLASSVDTSVPVACRYFEHLSAMARERGLATYYRTRFIESDVCANEVDFVLLDARGTVPAALLGRWQRVHDTPAGIGTLGVEVDDGVRGGYLTPRSPAAQARFLEDGLLASNRVRPRPTAVFVLDWRSDDFGLLTSEGNARPALEVVRGMYSGNQFIFAIDAGAEPTAPPGAGGFTLLGWLLACFVIVLLGVAPRFRELIPRYFMHHGYYREAVQRSMGLEGYAAVSVSVGLCLAGGLIIGVLLQAMLGTSVYEVAFSGIGETQRNVLTAALRRPLLMVLLGAIPYALWILVNMVWLRLLAGKRYRVRPMQAAVLATFSRWPVFVLAVVVLLAVNSGDPIAWLPWIVGLWIAVEVVAAPRMLYDFAKITRVPMGRAVGAGLLVPLALGGAMTVALVLAAGPEGAFLWHLVTRT